MYSLTSLGLARALPVIAALCAVGCSSTPDASGGGAGGTATQQPTGATPTAGTYSASDSGVTLTFVVSSGLHLTSFDADLSCSSDNGSYERSGKVALDVDVTSGYFAKSILDVPFVGTWSDATTVAGTFEFCPAVYDKASNTWNTHLPWKAHLQ